MASFPIQQAARVEASYGLGGGPSPLYSSTAAETCSSPSFTSFVSPLPIHMEALEASTYLDEVGHQRRLNLLPEASMASPVTCPNAYYGLRKGQQGVAATTTAPNNGAADDALTAGAAGTVGPPPVEEPSAPLLEQVFNSYVLGGGSEEDATTDDAAAGGDQQQQQASALAAPQRIHWKAAIPQMLRPMAFSGAMSKLDAISSAAAATTSSTNTNTNAWGTTNHNNITVNNAAAHSVNAPVDDTTAAAYVEQAAGMMSGAHDDQLRIHLEDCISKAHFETADADADINAAATDDATALPPPPSVGVLQTAVALHYLTVVTPLLATKPAGCGAVPLSEGLVGGGGACSVTRAVEMQLERYSRAMRAHAGRSSGSESPVAAVEVLDAACPLFLSSSSPSPSSLSAAFGAADNALVDGLLRGVYDKVHAYITSELMARSNSNTKDSSSSASGGKVFIITGLGALAASTSASSAHTYLNGLACLLWALGSLMHHLRQYVPSMTDVNAANHHAATAFAPLSSSAAATALLAATHNNNNGNGPRSLFDILHSVESCQSQQQQNGWGIRFVLVLPPSLATTVGDRLARHVSSKLRLSAMAVGVPMSDLAALTTRAASAHPNIITATGGEEGEKHIHHRVAFFSQKEEFGVAVDLKDGGSSVSAAKGSSSSSSPTTTHFALSDVWAAAVVDAAADRIVSLHNNAHDALEEERSAAAAEASAAAKAAAADDDDAVQYVNGGGDNDDDDDAKNHNVSSAAANAEDSYCKLFDGDVKRKQPVVVVVTPSTGAPLAEAVANRYTSVPIHITSLAALEGRMEALSAKAEAHHAVHQSSGAAAASRKQLLPLTKEALLAALIAPPPPPSADDGDDADAVDDDGDAEDDRAAVTFITVTHDEVLSLGGSGAVLGKATLSPLFRALFTFSGDVMHLLLRDSQAQQHQTAPCFIVEGAAVASHVALRAAVAVFGGDSLQALLPPMKKAEGSGGGGADGDDDDAMAMMMMGGGDSPFAFPRPHMEQLSVETPMFFEGSEEDAEGGGGAVPLVVRVLVPRLDASTRRSGYGTVDPQLEKKGDDDGDAEDNLASSSSPSPLGGIAKFLHNPMPITLLESLFLCTAAGSSSHLPSSVGALHLRQLSVLVLAVARRLRASDGDVALITSNSRAHKARARGENDKRKMDMVKRRKQQQQGKSSSAASAAEADSTAAASKHSALTMDANGNALMDYCAALSHDSAAATVALLSDALLDILLLENPLSLSSAAAASASSSSSPSVAKGWVGDVVHFLVHSGVVAPVRAVQNTLKALPPYLRAMERQHRMLSLGYAKLQESVRQYLRQQQQQQDGGNGAGAVAVVSGITNTAWAGTLAQSAVGGGACFNTLGSSGSGGGAFTAAHVVLSSCAVTLTPLGRRVSSLLLPTIPYCSGSSSSYSLSSVSVAHATPIHTTPIGLAAAKHLLIGQAYGLPIPSTIANIAATSAASGSGGSFALSQYLGAHTLPSSRAGLDAVASAIRRLLFVPLTGSMVAESLLSVTPVTAVPPIAKLAAAVAAWPERVPLLLEAGDGVAYVASTFCDRTRVFDPSVVERLLAGGGGGPSAASPSSPVSGGASASLRLPSRGWLTEASPIVIADNLRSSAATADDDDDEADETLTAAEKASRREQRRAAAAAKEAVKKQLTSASVQFGKSKKLFKKHRPEQLGAAAAADATSAAAAGGAAAADESLIANSRIPPRMTPIGMSLEVDPAQPNSEYLIPALNKAYPSMLRDECVVGTRDPIKQLCSSSSSSSSAQQCQHTLERSAVVPLGASDALIVLRLALRNSLTNLVTTLEHPQCSQQLSKQKAGGQTSSSSVSVSVSSALLDILEPTLRRPCERLKHLVPRLSALHEAMVGSGSSGAHSGGGVFNQHTSAAAALCSLMLMPATAAPRHYGGTNSSIASLVDSSIRYTYTHHHQQGNGGATTADAAHHSAALALIAALGTSCFTLPAELSCLPATSAMVNYAEEYTEGTAQLMAAAGPHTGNAQSGVVLSTFARLVAALVGGSSSHSSSSFNFLGLWLDSAVSADAASSSSSSTTALLAAKTSTYTLYAQMNSYSGRCAHTAFRSRASINDIIEGRRLAERQETDRRQQAAREAAVKLSGGGADGVASDVAMSDGERKIITNAVRIAKQKGRAQFEAIFKGKPGFGFVEEGDRLHGYYISQLVLEGAL